MTFARPRAALGAFAVAAIAFGLAPAARATATLETRVVSSAHAQDRLVLASDSDNRRARPGAESSAHVNTTLITSPSAFAASRLNAGIGVRSGPAATLISPTVTNFASLTSDGHLGHVDMLTNAVAQLTDRLTLTGAPGDARTVRLHGQFLLGDLPDGLSGFSLLSGDPAELNFSAEAHQTVRVVGDGVALSDQGDNIFIQRDFTADAHHRGTGALFPASPGIDLDLIMTLGQGRDFQLALLNTITISIDDFRGNLDARMQTEETTQLIWPGQIQAFDQATGAALCGLTLTAESGIAWGAIPACSGGGSGAAGAPEPTGWALMIAGFGLAGATLRRRRAPAAL